jgi:hypothetical protein
MIGNALFVYTRHCPGRDVGGRPGGQAGGQAAKAGRVDTRALHSLPDPVDRRNLPSGDYPQERDSPSSCRKVSRLPGSLEEEYVVEVVVLREM